MKRTALFLSLFAVVGSASATYCADNSPIGDHVNNDCHAPFKNPTKNPVGSTSESSSAAGAVAVGLGGKQQQQQGQQQGQRLNSMNESTSGVIIQGAQSGSGDTYIDKSRGSVFLPPVLFAPGLPPMAGVSGQPTVTACGPRQAIYREPVYAIMRNTFMPDERKFAGWDEYNKDVPAGEPRYTIEKVPTGFAPDGSLIEATIVWGEQAIIRTEALSRASGAGFSFGGFVKDVGGQAGASGQVQVQGFVTAISTVSCQMPIRPAVVVQTQTITLPEPPPRVIYRTRYRDRPAAPSCCCTAVVAPSCVIGGVK